MSQTSEKSNKDYMSKIEYQTRPSAMSILAMAGAIADELSEEVLSESETDSNESDATL